MPSSLGIGTAQFGLDYGVTNKKGVVSSEEAQKIIDEAYNSGVLFLDTAYDYGKSEEILGKTIRKTQKFKIISKISLPESIQKEAKLKEILDAKFSKSLKNLRTEDIDSLLIHKAKDLKSEHGNDFLIWLKDLKTCGLVNRIGISLYDFEDISDLDLSDFDIVQIPISIFDQRFLKKGYLKNILESGCKIHVRSIFLQGLILAKNSELPDFLSKEFKSHHNNFCDISTSNKVSQLYLACSFIKNLNDIECTLIGVENLKQFSEILNIWNKNDLNLINPKLLDFNWDKIQDIDPRFWN
tara:strand:- start:542 stop:1432 length:891 start_codon:yes stop_codon:yes gene_type:complete